LKKPTPRRRRRQASAPPDDIKAYLDAAAKGGLVCNRGPVTVALVPANSGLPLPAPSFGLDPRVIRHGKTKHGPRSARRLEHAQAEINALYPRALPDVVNVSALTIKLNNRRAKRGEAEKFSRQTVMRALQTLREANR
jgi:hypothetical protein